MKNIMSIVSLLLSVCVLTVISSSLCYAYKVDIVDVRDIALPCSPSFEAAQWDKTEGEPNTVVALVTRGMHRPAEGDYLIRNWGGRSSLSTIPVVHAICTPTKNRKVIDMFPWFGAGEPPIISPLICKPGHGVSVIMASPICIDPKDPNDPKACTYYGRMYRFRVTKNTFGVIKKNDLEDIREFLSERLEGLPEDVQLLAPTAPCME